MKTLTALLLSLSVILVLTSCSNDNESFEPITETPEPQLDNQNPMDSLANIGAVAIAGYPKMIKKYENGILSYWAQYYFRPDGNILKVNYGYPSHPLLYSYEFSNNYLYNTEGKIVRLDSEDVFDFYWDNGRISKVEAYNGAWYGRYDIFYDYNHQGQVIQKLVVYYGTTPISSQKLNYTYFNDGNIKSIEEYGDYNGIGIFELYFETNFTDYIEPRNLFLNLEIIPGQIEHNQFPKSKEFRYGNEYINIIYNYKFDTLGRVIEQRYGNNKTIYEYY